MHSRGYGSPRQQRWQAVGCVEAISERHLLPVLEALVEERQAHWLRLQRLEHAGQVQKFFTGVLEGCEQLDAVPQAGINVTKATPMSDTEAAKAMRKVKNEILKRAGVRLPGDHKSKPARAVHYSVKRLPDKKETKTQSLYCSCSCSFLNWKMLFHHQHKTAKPAPL